jgi:hypothetical protein
MNYDQIVFSRHAVERMFEREISASDVERMLGEGEVIEDYPDDAPFPSAIVLGFVNDSPVHVVAALDSQNERCHVITVYRPDPALWDAKFRRRRRR